MITPAALITSADEIDNRLGPIAGRSSDRIAVELRSAAKIIAIASEMLAAAKEVMAALEQYGGSIVPHLIDTDMNAGQRLRDAIAKAETA